MVEYPRWLKQRTQNYDLFHILDHSYAHLALALPPGRAIITCHDLDSFRCLLEPAREPRPAWFRAMTRRVLTGLRSAAHVIFVSDAVRQEAESLGLLSNVNSSVVHNGADDGPRAGDDADRLADTLLGPGGGPTLLLSVGSTIQRKRIDVLLRVFAGVAKEFPGTKLVRVGGRLTGPQTDLARQLGILQSIIELPFVERAVLSCVYRRATLLLLPSDAEGFGLPVAEAMVYGCPVVASDLPVLKEVGGQAAMYCPAGDVSAWTRSVIELLRLRCDEPLYWAKLRSRSVENAARFNWRENTDRVVSIYREVAESAALSCGASLSPQPEKLLQGKSYAALGYEK
jgi:glycosyltransferase involved in cell wall biosynthesis